MDNAIANTARSVFLSTFLKLPYLKHYGFKVVLQVNNAKAKQNENL
jgi:hypothetical protein